MDGDQNLNADGLKFKLSTVNYKKIEVERVNSNPAPVARSRAVFQESEFLQMNSELVSEAGAMFFETSLCIARKFQAAKMKGEICVTFNLKGTSNAASRLIFTALTKQVFEGSYQELMDKLSESIDLDYKALLDYIKSKRPDLITNDYHIQPDLFDDSWLKTELIKLASKN